jgi:hypothetical protein
MDRQEKTMKRTFKSPTPSEVDKATGFDALRKQAKAVTDPDKMHGAADGFGGSDYQDPPSVIDETNEAYARRVGVKPTERQEAKLDSSREVLRNPSLPEITPEVEAAREAKAQSPFVANPDGPMFQPPPNAEPEASPQEKLERTAARYAAQVLFEMGVESPSAAIKHALEVLSGSAPVPDMVRIRGAIAILKAASTRWPIP